MECYTQQVIWKWILPKKREADYMLYQVLC